MVVILYKYFYTLGARFDGQRPEPPTYRGPTLETDVVSEDKYMLSESLDGVMRRRAYLSAVIGTGLSAGCVGNQRPSSDPGRSDDPDSDGGASGGPSSSDAQIDRTESPPAVPEPVRNERLRPSDGPTGDTEAIEISIHEYVNGLRRAYELPLFPWNEDMNETARSHSQDMAHNGYFAREAPDGQTFRPNGCSTWAEILFRTRGRDTPPDVVAEEAIRAWMNSDPHRSLLLHEEILRHGVGVAKSSDGWIYVSHSLCR